MSDAISNAWEKYLLQLQLHPLRTKAITSGVLAGCSDAVAQKISGFKKLQLRRLLLIMLYGFVYAGPFGHFFHKLMDIIFKGKKGRPWGLVKQKIRNDYPSVQLTAWRFWPIAAWVNYRYMPLHLRVLFHSFVASCWGVFLNLKARSAALKAA